MLDIFLKLVAVGACVLVGWALVKALDVMFDNREWRR
jgi:hypothetical protein